MGRTPLFRALARVRSIAHWCDEGGVSTDEGLDRIATISRRRFLETGTTAIAGTAAFWYASRLAPAFASKPAAGAPSVAIVGAGLAGLACATELRRRGVVATLFDANDRVGGRCYSLSGVFPGQVAERGGEFIDTFHKTMLGYANAFDLQVEDVNKQGGELFYYFDGSLHAEKEVVDEYRALVPAMRNDVKTTSGAPTADSHTAGDVALDLTTTREWLETRGAGDLIAAVIESAYIGEYGREIDEQSCLSLLFFMHADRRAKFAPFGIFSDERYHVVGGNDLIAVGLAEGLPGQIALGERLIAAGKSAGGKIVLTFAGGSSATADAVVFALPFSTLRDVDLSGLTLPAWKTFAIDNFVYGTNAKLMVGFDGRPWRALGGSGQAYSDLARLQTTWETNPILGTDELGILTDYTGGDLGAGLNPNSAQARAEEFLADAEVVFPGAAAAATRDAGGSLLVDLWHWPSHPLWKGSYTCNAPGYFTTIAGNEAKPVGNVYFAGEHTNSFFEAQGFMEGAALSGIDAAKRIFDDFRVRGQV